MTYELSTWDLSDITEDVDKVLGELDKQSETFAKRRGELVDDIATETFLDLVKELEGMSRESSKVGCYAYLKTSEDFTDSAAAALRSKVENVLTKLGNRVLFFGLWFKDLPDTKADELIKASGKNKYHFEALRKLKPYTLKENEEKIINIKDVTGTSALVNVYDILTSQFEYELDGKKLMQEELTSFVRDPDPKKREAAYRELFSKYEAHKDVIGEIYKNVVNDWREESIGLRGYKSPIEVRDKANDLPSEAVEALLAVCERNQPLFHRFFALKKKTLGLEKMRRFDIYAPFAESDATYSYDQAVTMVLDTFGEFSKEFRDGVQRMLDKKHIHSNVQKGKRSGAFSYAPSNTVDPYVMLTYTGKIRDVSTLAHELGHAVHSILAQGQTEFTHHACLPLAETASIFGEMLLTERLLKQDPGKAKDLMFLKLDDLYASIIRQAGFVMFEKKAHKMMEEGKTMDEMSQVYLDDVRKQLGDGVEVDDIFRYEWSYIPHIEHTPFYCYAYAFGNLLVLGLWELYKEQGKAFVPKMIDFLATGGSKEPVEMTKKIGIDICSEAFWQKGFDVIKGMIDTLENE